mmetsp:Transcript_4755/g.14438  ORF Transcript_4755/g.14438 Transcript_4755/m.14438 type:complete len:266 (-) Transcript_4755:294-1091(-)
MARAGILGGWVDAQAGQVLPGGGPLGLPAVVRRAGDGEVLPPPVSHGPLPQARRVPCGPPSLPSLLAEGSGRGQCRRGGLVGPLGGRGGGTRVRRSQGRPDRDCGSGTQAGARPAPPPQARLPPAAGLRGGCEIGEPALAREPPRVALLPGPWRLLQGSRWRGPKGSDQCPTGGGSLDRGSTLLLHHQSIRPDARRRVLGALGASSVLHDARPPRWHLRLRERKRRSIGWPRPLRDRAVASCGTQVGGSGHAGRNSGRGGRRGGV